MYLLGISLFFPPHNQVFFADEKELTQQFEGCSEKFQKIFQIIVVM